MPILNFLFGKKWKQPSNFSNGEHLTSEKQEKIVISEQKSTQDRCTTSSIQDNHQCISVHHLIVLDESGSMSGVTEQTISGCNETIQTIRQMQSENADQKHFVSIYLFDTGNSRYIVKGQPVGNVKEITAKDYHPNSCTPLFDALGDTLTELRQLIGEASMGYVTIITDGYENASQRFTLNMVKALIGQLKEMGVIFSFIGANIDAATYARSMDIDNAMQFQQDDKGTRDMWERERQSKMRSVRQKWNT